MSKLQAARSDTSEAFLAEIGPELAALCTACGACFNACPMVDRVELRGSDPRSTTDGLRRLAKGEMGSPETIKWVGACAKSHRALRDLRAWMRCCWSGSPSSARSTRRVNCRSSRTRHIFRASKHLPACSSLTRSSPNGCRDGPHHFLVRMQHASARRNDPAFDHASGAGRL